MNNKMLVPIAALIFLTSFATAFALINNTNRVRVWPLMQSASLTLVIGVSFVLGAGVGVLLRSLYHLKQSALPVPPTAALRQE